MDWCLSRRNARHAFSRSSHVPHERPSPSTHDGNASSPAPSMDGPAIHAASTAHTAGADAGSTSVAPQRAKYAGPAHAAPDAGSRWPATLCSFTSAPRCIRHAACVSDGYGSRSTWDGCSQQISSAWCAGAAAGCRNSAAGSSSSCRRPVEQAGAGGSSSSCWRYGGSGGHGHV